MTRKELYAKTLEYLSNEFRFAETELDYETPFELLVAVILSAQCTDKRVNLTTPALFEQYPDAQTMAKAEPEDIFRIIRSISYPNNKSKHLVAMARKLVDEFGGEVPQEVSQLQSLQGVGRKTAHVVTSVLYRQPNMAVDTHVMRVSNRIGLTTNTARHNPLLTEKQLVRHIPEADIPDAHHWLILHGRYVCVARNPKCEECGLSDICKYFAQNIRSLQK
jgi:endonuclease III